MNNSRSIEDRIVHRMNEQAEAEGRRLHKTFPEIERKPGSIFDVGPLTPEDEVRIQQLDAAIKRIEAEKAARVNQSLEDTRTDLGSINIIDIQPGHSDADAYIEEGVEG